jgi:6-phosphogluconolactonase
MVKNISTILFFLFAATLFSQNNRSTLFVGTYTTTCESKGIYIYDFDTQTADYVLKTSTEKVVNPSYLSLSEDKKFVYSVNENGAESQVLAFGFDSKTNTIHFINQQSSKGADPCYIIDDEKNVLVANYSGGSVSVFKKNPDGSLSEAKQTIQYFGHGINPKRQERAHAHMVQFSPDKEYVLVSDLGTDRIYVYKYNPNSKDKILTLKNKITVKEGSGPRHLTFSKDGKIIYLLQELDASLTVFNFDNGDLKKLQQTKIVSPDFTGKNGAADIHISPDGNYLYATNRGTANEISCFEIKENGILNFKFSKSTLGRTPRNFAIDPDGNYLLVANQNSDYITIFRINKANGELLETDKKIEVCAPVCLVFTKI